VGAFPNIGGIAEGFQVSSKSTRSVSSGRESAGEEKRIDEPQVFKAKTLGAGNGSGGGDNERFRGF
jgi:hypothetical protein